MKIGLQMPSAQWYKTESAAVGGALMTILGALLFGLPWEPGVLATIAATAAAFVTVKE